MTKGIFIGVFGLMVLAQWWVPISMVREYETILNDGYELRLQTQPVDPYDVFRGRYVYLSYKDESVIVDTTESWQDATEVYVRFTTDGEGFSKIAGVTLQPPAEGDFLKAEVSYMSDSLLWITYPFTTYYMEEHKAPEAELRFNEATRDPNQKTYAVVKILNGKGVLADVYIDGISLSALTDE